MRVTLSLRTLQNGTDCTTTFSVKLLLLLLSRLPNPKIVKACSLSLKNFEVNSDHTNHCVVKLLHRIAFDCKMYVMLFQLSLFRTFQRIFAAKDLPQHQVLFCKSSVISSYYNCITGTGKVCELRRKTIHKSGRIQQESFYGSSILENEQRVLRYRARLYGDSWKVSFESSSDA